MDKPRVAWFSPLNTASQHSDSICAYCSDLLLPLLCERYEIEVFHDSFESYRAYPTAHFVCAVSRHQKRPFDFFVYQIEDAKRCDFVRMHLGLMPGVVLFHDFLLQTETPAPLRKSEWGQHVSALVEGPVVCGGRKEPRALREAALAAVALFSDECVHGEFQRSVRGCFSRGGERLHSWFLPAPAAVPGALQPRVRVRRLGYAGSLNVEERAHKVLLAMSRINEPFELVWLVSDAELERARALALEYGVSRVCIEGGRSPERWAELVGDCDAALHPLFSAYGRTSPYLQISLMAGLPLVVSRFGSCEFLPDSFAFKADPGHCEALQIEAALQALLSSDISAASAQAGVFARENFAVEVVAAELSRALEISRLHLAKVMRRSELAMESAKRELVSLSASHVPYAYPQRGAVERVLGGEFPWSRVLEPVFRELAWKE